MVEEKEEEKDGLGLGTLITVGAVVLIAVIGLGVYNSMMEPYWTADDLRQNIYDSDNLSDDYIQGWLDCVDYYLKMKTEPTNMTSGINIVKG